ncbi:hypothetical protein ACQE3E_16545 [Methylomonas sp. MED-D]|uniref:hypothetical protein n=1 Tax=unclassified Methylomonas TaxID=2608980 RepID=UPI0028A3E0F3|nr:hypothetical protein [Methylomonas sp. MV1]MDT4331032.1 hypothetical protein [Methylomonas sp. MV1]
MTLTLLRSQADAVFIVAARIVYPSPDLGDRHRHVGRTGNMAHARAGSINGLNQSA